MHFSINTVFAFLAIFVAGKALGQDVERLQEPAFDIDRVLRGDTFTMSPTDWAVRGQLVWIEGKRELERRVYEVWRGPAEKGLSFRWTPEDITVDLPGRVTGRGQISWRSPGSADYGNDATLATYRGDMLNGKRHGAGTYRTAFGFSYEGDWRNGHMHGHGEVAFSNGDHYVGGFRNGKLHGKGRYIDAEGIVLEGNFFDGQPDGRGLVRRPDEMVYDAIWQHGKELKDSRTFLARPRVTKATLEDEYRVGVTVDSPSVADNSSEYGVEYTDIQAYRTRATGEVLIVEPSSDRIMNVWSGTEKINLEWQEEYNRDAGGGFLGIREVDVKPLNIVFEFDNRSRDDVRIVNAEIAVQESKSLLRPMLQVSRGLDDHCNGARPFFDPAFRLENFGWAPLSNGTLRVNFPNKSVPTIVFDITGLHGTKEISLLDALSKLGVNPNWMKSGFFVCERSANSSEESCLRALRETGAFGAIAEYIEPGADRVFVPVFGKLEYAWRSAAGAIHRSNASFSTKLSLGTNGGPTECGEGGNPSDVAGRAFKFSLDRENYKMRIRLRDNVPAGVTARWRIPVEADQNSFHRFQLLLELSDGRIVPSRPIELTYLRPRAPK